MSTIVLMVFLQMMVISYASAYPAISTGPLSSPSSIAVNNKTGIVYITQNGTNSISVMGGKDFFIFMMLPTGQQPMSVAVNNKTNLIYVANNGSNNITIINGSTNSFSFMSVGSRPVSVAVNPVTNMTYVANNGSSSVTVIPKQGNAYTLSGSPFSFSKPVSVAVNPVTNRTYVTNIGDNSVTVIPKTSSGSAYKLTQATYGFSKPVSVAVNPVTNSTYIANNYTNTVTIIKGDNTFSSLSVGINPVSIAVNPQTNRTYVVNQGSNSITVIKGSVVPNIIYTIGGFNKPVSVAINPTTNATYVVNRGNNTVSIIPGDAIIGGFNPALPTAPTNLQAVPGNGQVTLTWFHPSFNGTGAPLTSYVIQKSTNFGQTFSTVFTGSLANSSKIINGLANDQPIVFRVNATNPAGTGPGSFPLFATPSVNPVGQFIAPPPPPSPDMIAAMVAKGLPPNFVMPSPNEIASGSFHPFAMLKTLRGLNFTTPSAISSKTMFSDYPVQSYTPPADWNPNNVWSVPPQMAPLSGDPGMMGMFKMSQAIKNKPFFLPLSGATPLSNGAVLGGVKMALGSNASNLQVASQFLKSPPPGLPSVSNAFMYLNFSLQDNNGINFHDAAQFSSPPQISFTVAPIAHSTSKVSPINTVNSALTCPNVSVSLLNAGGTIDTSGITVSRDTTGDTSTTCGYTASIQHFSSYGIGGILDSSSSGSIISRNAPSLSTIGTNSYPVEINGNMYGISDLTTGKTPVLVNTGEQASITVRLFDQTGAQNISHVGLYMDFSQSTINPAFSNTAIIHDTSDSMLNSNNNIKSYSVKTSQDGNILTATFNIMFAKPMGTQDVMLRYWNTFGKSQDTVIPHAINVVNTAGVYSPTTTPTVTPAPSTTVTPAPSTTVTPAPSTTVTPAPSTITPAAMSDLVPVIKDWAGYSSHPISNAEMLNDLGVKGNIIPTWIGKTTKWVIDGDLTQNEFVNVIKYLSDKNIIK